MPAVLTLLTPVVSATPGGEGSASVRVKNTGTIVDQFAINLLGEASAWGVVDPPFVSLFPGAEETVTVRFHPPRSSTVAAGGVPFGVRVTSKEEPDFSLVEEGSVQVTGFSSVTAKVVPRTSQGRSGAEHRVEITNTGNEPVEATITALDPDDLLAIAVVPDVIAVPPGRMAVAKVRVAARSGARQPGRRLPFQVTIDAGTGVPTTADAAFEAKGGFPIALVLAILAVAAVLVVLVMK